MPNDALDVFWVRPVIVDKEELNDGDGDTSFAGIYNTLALPKLLGGAKLETYGLALNQTPSVASADSDIYTLGSRFSAKPRRWDFDVEAAWQFGNVASDSVAAYSLAME